MDRIKTRQEKFKKGKQKMLSMAEESGEGQNLVPDEPEPEPESMAVILIGHSFSLYISA